MKQAKIERLNPTPKDPKLVWCKTENRTIFEDQRELCEMELHEVEPLKGQMFTDTDEYFTGVEQDADDRGEIEL